MPQPDKPPAWRIDGGLGDHALWWLVEHRVSVRITCARCSHRAIWRPVDLDQRFARRRGKTLGWVAARLRCSRCRHRTLILSTIAGSLMSHGGSMDLWG
jgi:DNA-directed RNA polymerase subunit RPC12/RpoP